MPAKPCASASRRRSVNLTIRADVMETVKALHLNASKAAEAGMIQAIKEAQEQKWLAENRAAITAHNDRIDQEGMLLSPEWARQT